jgi:hypothetical protein
MSMVDNYADDDFYAYGYDVRLFVVYPTKMSLTHAL